MNESVPTKRRVSRSRSRPAASPALLDALLETVDSLVLCIDAAGRIAYFSRSCEKITGWSASEVIGKDWRTLVPSDEAGDVASVVDALWAGTSSNRHQNHWTTRSGERRLIAWSNTVARGPDGRGEYVVATGTDVTDLERTLDALRRSERELTIRNRIAQIFLTASLDETYSRVLEVVLEAMDSQHGIFGYIDRSGSLVCPSLTDGIWDQCRMSSKTATFPPGTWGGIWGEALEGKRSVCANRMMRVPHGHISVDRALAVPLVHQGKAVGLFVVGNRPRDYQSEDVALLESIAASTAPVLWSRVEREWHEARRRDAQRALEQSEQRYRMLFDSASDAIFIHDLAGRFLEVNEVACRRLGYTREELLGLSPREIDAPEFAALVGERLQAILERGSAMLETAHVRRDGARIPTELSARLIEYGGGPAVLAIARDISERKRSEAGLKQAHDELEARVRSRTAELEQANAALVAEIAERRRIEEVRERLQSAVSASELEWRLTFDAVTFPVLVTAPDGRVLKVNSAALGASGRSVDEILGQSIAQLGAGEPWQEASRLLQAAGAAPEGAAGRVRDAATGRTWDVAASAFTMPGTGQPRVIVVARDDTELVELQDSLRRTETMSAMGSLVAGVAHEVRNPLFGISATLDAFEARFAVREEFAPYVRVLRDQVDRLTKLMHDLLDFGRPSSLELAPTAIDAVLAQAVRSCAPSAEARGVRLEHGGSEPLRVEGDERRLVQVFHNLLDNAMQHSARGGVVLARATSVDAEGRRWVECTVEDEGPGFRPEDLPKVFKPFFTRRREGTGLGLSIVQRIVEEHGGTVVAENRSERGARIRVRLPAPRGG